MTLWLDLPAPRFRAQREPRPYSSVPRRISSATEK